MRKWMAPVVAAVAAVVVGAPGAAAAGGNCLSPYGCIESSVINGGICWDPQRSCRVRVVINRAHTEDIRVLLSTIDGTAAGGRDFTALRDAVLVIPRGRTSVDVEVPLLRTGIGSRSFGLEIRKPSTGVVAQARTEVEIRS